jgi:hypothetical protein
MGQDERGGRNQTRGREALRAGTTRADALRSAAVVAAAAAQAIVPSLVPIFGAGREEVERNDTAITPPAYAFAIWAPIFALGIANAVQQGLPQHRDAGVNRAGAWPLAGAQALNAAWVLAAQPGRFVATPFVLGGAVTCAATAYRRQQREAAEGIERLAPASTGLLLGWIGLAAVVNTASVAQRLGVAADEPATTALWSSAAAGVAGLAASGILRSRHGYLPLAASVVWGLATTAATPERPPLARIGALVGTLAVAGASVARLRRGGPGGERRWPASRSLYVT